MTYFCDAHARLAKDLTPGVRTRTFWTENMLVSLLEFAPNSVIPNHRHPQEQVGVIVEGELHMTIGGETRLMKPGEAYVIPANVEHGGKTGNKPAKVFDAFNPARDDYKY